MNPPESINSTIEPIIAALRIVAGKRLDDGAPCIATLAPPPQAPRARSGERLFILLDVIGPASSHLYRELREVTAQTYWAASGSITAALRQAAMAANRRLFQANRRSAPTDRGHGSLICAVLRDTDLFILQAGSAGACLFHQGRPRCFSHDDELDHLGTGQLADTRLHHTYVAPGDKLLLASPALMHTMGDEGLVRMLARVKVDEVLDGLEQTGAGADFSALVARWPLPGESVAARETLADSVKPRRFSFPRLGRKPQRQTPTEREPRRPLFRPQTAPAPEYKEPAPIPTAPPIQTVEPRELVPAEPEMDRVAPIPVEPSPPEPELDQVAPISVEPPPPEPVEHDDVLTGLTEPPVREVETSEPPPPEFIENVMEEQEIPYEREQGPGLGERVEGIARSTGRGLATAGGFLVGGASTLFRRMLPASRKQARRRARSAPPPRSARPVPQENRAVMMAVAIGIPLVLAVTVTMAYRVFGTDARFNGLVKQAEQAVGSAQAVGSGSELSRSHWGTALEHATAAAELRPDDQVAAALQAQAQTALDSLDGIVRLQPILLMDFGPGGDIPRRLVAHGQMIFVLDPSGGWVSRLTLNQAGNGLVEPGGMTIVRKDQTIGEGTVGDMVDFVWVDLAGGRQTSGLLILEQDGALVSYDPAWEGEGGAIQLQRSFLGMPPESPRAISTYDGRLYILDTALNQIRRYEPRGDTYPERPDHYFVIPPPRPLADVLDLAIDGYIYLLHADGEIVKFLRGDPDPFDVRGLPRDLSQAVALAVDADSGSGVIYVSDRGSAPGSGRVVELGPDGEFRAQFYGGAAFDGLEAIAVDEAVRRIYVVSGGRLYVASLP